MRRQRESFICKAAGILTALSVFGILLWAFLTMVKTTAEFAQNGTGTARTDAIDENAGAGRATAYLSGVSLSEGYSTAEKENAALRAYTEGEGTPPEWWNPDEPMAVEWTANAQQFNSVDYNAPDGIDPGGVDWNICTTLWGWNGHGAEAWELDLLARVFYLEFWGTSLPCSEAGCDAILNLWDTGRYGRTLFDALSYYDPDYGYTYRVYPKVWQTDYNPEGLAWCREFCEGRFVNGPEWEAQYFQLGGYHDPDWVTPAYEIDGVYFSTGR